MKTKKKLGGEIKIPDNVEINIDDFIVKVKGPKGIVQKKLYNPRIAMLLKGKVLLIKPKEKKPSKNDKTIIGTFKAHILNMIKGAVDGFEYKLKICSGHFPMSVSIEGDKILIKNFMGEKVPRKATIMPGADVKIEDDIIKVTGINKETVSQTAARIEQTTRITKRDRRVFQDGCYIISKADKEL